MRNPDAPSFHSIPVLSGHIFSGLHDNEPKQQVDNKNICFIEDLSSPITTHSHANPETTSRSRTLPKSSLSPFPSLMWHQKTEADQHSHLV